MNIPSNVKNVRAYAFYNAYKLVTVIIEEGSLLEEIGDKVSARTHPLDILK